MGAYHTDYATVAASQTAQVIGPVGAKGDLLERIIIVPAVVACGVVTVLDNSTAIVSFPGGGTTALTDCRPISIPVGVRSTSGAFKITTGANVSVLAVGKFT